MVKNLILKINDVAVSTKRLHNSQQGSELNLMTETPVKRLVVKIKKLKVPLKETTNLKCKV